MTELPTGDTAGGTTPEPAPPPPPEPADRLAPGRPGAPRSRRPTGEQLDGADAAAKRRRRGSRGGRNRSRPRAPTARCRRRPRGRRRRRRPQPRAARHPTGGAAQDASRPPTPRWSGGRPPRRPASPQIGDSMPGPPAPPPGRPRPVAPDDGRRPGQAQAPPRRPRARQWRRRRRRPAPGRGPAPRPAAAAAARVAGSPVQAVLPTGGVDLDDDILEARRGRERKGRPVGRYLMCVHVDPKATQIAVLEGRNLIEHYVSRPVRRRRPDPRQHLPRARSRTCCPGMEAAFVDIGTPKNAVLYRGDVHFDADDVEAPQGQAEQPAHRADAQGQADDHLPGHQEPDRRQGRPPHPGGVAARAGSWC